MKKQRTIRLVVLLVIFMSLLLVAAMPQQKAFAKSDLVRLTIVNGTDQGVWLKLEGPAYYYLYVKPGQTRTYTPERDVYESTLYSCGTYVKHQTLDLTKHTKYEVPSCGTHAYPGDGPTDTVDAGKVIKLVDVTLKNETGHNIIVVLGGPNGPSQFAFFLYDEESKEYTIPKGYYDYNLYGCGDVRTGHVFAIVHKVKEFKCP
ncbi:MAG: hypothetical protein U9Q82_05765 [Chloroflexota bacterium]|nr:hypothetical protein [Chloroflexota bacterium]